MDSEMEELPGKIPVLPYKNRVLLPGAVIRVTCTSPSSLRLVETQLWQKPKPGLVGLVPAMDSLALSSKRPSRGVPRTQEQRDTAGVAPRRASGSEDDEGAEKDKNDGASVSLQQWLLVAAHQLEPVDFQHRLSGGGGLLHDDLQWHKRGVLARAIHVGKRPQGKSRGGPFVLVLQGLMRFEISRLHTRGPYHMADVVYHPATTLEDPGEEAELHRLARQFQRVSVLLNDKLAGKGEHSRGIMALIGGGSEARTGVPGSARGAPQASQLAHLADVLVACLEPGFAPRLAMLDATSLTARLGTAIDILSAVVHDRNGSLRHTEGTQDEHSQLTPETEGSEMSKERGEGLGELSSSDLRRGLSKGFGVGAGKKYVVLPGYGKGEQGGRQGEGAAGGVREGGKGKEDNEEEDEEDEEVGVLEKRLQKAGLPGAVWKQVRREIRRLKKMQPQQPGYSTTMQYLELIADLPWGNMAPFHGTPGVHGSSSKGSGALGGGDIPSRGLCYPSQGRPSVAGVSVVNHLDREERASSSGVGLGGFTIDVAAAREQLDREHFGLEKVKQRIVEYIAVRKLKADAAGPVLCFVGPPGVGKTSLASSIAAALGRKFVRIALGGVKDEADIRGHRRTYVGSMPGRIIDGLKKVGVNNPVMLLDEIDKTGSDARGDPAAALLEVLDPEQNKHFTDHYVGLPFDLSNVVFLATANRTAPIPPPLLDRMEVTELPGYTPEEKQRIAVRHLIPRTLDSHGLTPQQLHIPEHIVELVIQRYTREAGVRSLSRQLASLARAAAVQVAQRKRAGGIAREVAPPSSETEAGGGASDKTKEGYEDGEFGGGGRGGEGRGGGRGGNNVRGGNEGGCFRGGGSNGGMPDMEMDVGALGLNADEIAAAMVEMEPIMASEAMVEAVLGPPKFDGKEAAERVATPGVAVGLVWTAVGGEVQFVEATLMAGKGELHLTGQLGDVIKESAQIALTWVRSRAADLLVYPGQPRRSPSQGRGQNDEPVMVAAPRAVGTAAESKSESWQVHQGMPSGAPRCAVGVGKAFGQELEQGGLDRQGPVGEQHAELPCGSSPLVHPGASLTPYASGSLVEDQAGAAVQRYAKGAPVVMPIEAGDIMRNRDIHIHFPAGATPKDGPSAGVTLVTALVSLLTHRCVRADTAMTGEITLRGLTLPVGGIKDKILAAHRCGIRRVILPQKNIKDLQDVPAATLACMEILPTTRIEDVLQEAFEGGCPVQPLSRL